MKSPLLYGLSEGSDISVRETHASLVFLAGNRAYKVKKAVRLPFLDYSDLARRRQLCLDEVRLNSPYAPGTYLGVRAIVPTSAGFRLAGPDDPGAVEYAVEMRRLDEDRTLERLVPAGQADEQLIERVARRIAELHANAPLAPPGAGDPSHTWRLIADNLDVLRAHTDSLLDPEILSAVRHYAERFAKANAELMSARVAAGRVRECHGDLRAEHIVVDDGITIFDRLEFDDRLRRIDVAADLAFLVMDLERLGAEQLARTLVRAYVDASGDPALRDLLPFYSCYRAAVRSKVACVRLDQLDPDAPGRAELAHEARSLLALSLRFAWRSRLPLALVFCGVAGSGKSTLATEVANRSGLSRVGSDEVRKRLAGLGPSERGDAELYSRAHTDRTYEQLISDAEARVRADGGVVVDATFREQAQRRALTAALRAAGARVLFCECRASEPALLERGRARERAPEHGSDATWDVISEQRASFDPLDDVAAGDHLVIDTDRPVAASMAQVETRVG